MRIIERKDWELQTTCPCCKSVLGVTKEDVRYGDFGVQYADDHDWHFYFVCAVCSKQVRITQSLPPDVADTARWKAGRK
jgi:hypothetical protein